MTRQRTPHETPQDFLISFMRWDENEFKSIDTCIPVRLKDTTERSAKIRATRKAIEFGLIPTSGWSKPDPTMFTRPSLKTARDPHTNESRSIIVQRVSKMTR